MRPGSWSKLLIVLLAALAFVAICAERAAPRPVAHPRAVEIVFLDVGQGDAALILSPDGRRVLVDGGPRGSGVAGYLRRRGIDTLDLVVASHNHADHIGGLRAVFDSVVVRNYMENGLPAATMTYSRLVDAVARSGARVLEPTQRTLTLGELAVDVLPSPPDATTQNDRSVGLVVRFGKFRALFTGDAEMRAIGYWLERELLPRTTVTKVSHHGSWNGSTAALVNAVDPAVAIISVGTGAYGHPSPTVLRLWADGARQVLRTDRHGHITLNGAADGSVRLSTVRGNPPLRDLTISPRVAAGESSR